MSIIALSFALVSLIRCMVAGKAEFQRYDGWYNNPNHLDACSVGSNIIRMVSPATEDYEFRLSDETLDHLGDVVHADLDHLFQSVFGMSTQLAGVYLAAQMLHDDILGSVSTANENIACPIEKTFMNLKNSACSLNEREQIYRSAFDKRTGQHPNNERQIVSYSVNCLFLIYISAKFRHLLVGW